MSEPRTWLVYWNNGGFRLKGPAPVEGEYGTGIEVIEAHPVAEVLERVATAMREAGWAGNAPEFEEVHALLARLPPSSSPRQGAVG